jgi:excisionase family DNA binding protein
MEPGRREQAPTDARIRFASPIPGQRRFQAEQHLTASDVMTAAEVAELLGVPISTVHHWARARAIPSRKIGRRRLFVRSRIEALFLYDET